MIGDRGHMRHDIWCGVNILTKRQVSSSNDLGAMIFLRSEGKGSVTQLSNQ